MSITPVTPAENSKGKVKTWVNSQWKFRPIMGQFSVQLNSLLEPIGNIPPAEAEARYCAQAHEPAVAA